jgi:hypothetical protein
MENDVNKCYYFCFAENLMNGRGEGRGEEVHTLLRRNSWARLSAKKNIKRLSCRTRSKNNDGNYDNNGTTTKA